MPLAIVELVPSTASSEDFAAFIVFAFTEMPVCGVPHVIGGSYVITVQSISLCDEAMGWLHVRATASLKSIQGLTAGVGWNVIWFRPRFED